MELLIYKDKHSEYTYYLDRSGEIVYHGERIDYHDNGVKYQQSFYYHGKQHGEYKLWGRHSGTLLARYFYVNGKYRRATEMTDQEKLLFQIQHPGFQFIEN